MTWLRRLRLVLFGPTADQIARSNESSNWRADEFARKYGGGLLCERCRNPIASLTAENDFTCATHGFVNAIRVRDGAVLAGDGVCGEPKVLRMDTRTAPYHGFEVLG
jgi:hypothetical protein